jgi:hypothetical protein
MSMKTQAKQVLGLLESGQELTRLDGMKRGIGNLPARIMELRDAGHDIATDMRDVEKADGTTARIAYYRLERTGQLESGI